MEPRITQQIGNLFTAELQFRLASAVRLASTRECQPLDLPIAWSHGKHQVTLEEIALRPDQGDFAAWAMQRSATFLMAVAMKDAIRVAVTNPKNHTDPNIVGAYQISRIIRNAFAHAPFDPVWNIDPDCRNRKFEVDGIISFDTSSLDGQRFDWRHYGGPLAILKLCRYVRFQILGDQVRPREAVPVAGAEIYQMGDEIFEKLDDDTGRGGNDGV